MCKATRGLQIISISYCFSTLHRLRSRGICAEGVWYKKYIDQKKLSSKKEHLYSPGGRGQACLLSLYVWHGGTQGNSKLTTTKIFRCAGRRAPDSRRGRRPAQRKIFLFLISYFLGRRHARHRGRASMPAPARRYSSATCRRLLPLLVLAN